MPSCYKTKSYSTPSTMKTTPILALAKEKETSNEYSSQRSHLPCFTVLPSTRHYLEILTPLGTYFLTNANILITTESTIKLCPLLVATSALLVTFKKFLPALSTVTNASVPSHSVAPPNRLVVLERAATTFCANVSGATYPLTPLLKDSAPTYSRGYIGLMLDVTSLRYVYHLLREVVKPEVLFTLHAWAL